MEIDVVGETLQVEESFVAESPGEIRRQVDEYERGRRQSFDLSVRTPDSFTGSVMDQLLEIPYGETRTYGEIAAAIDTAPVAVGGACGRNPVPVVVPCHRVLRSDGGLGGYSASGGVDVKQRLLDHESRWL